MLESTIFLFFHHIWRFGLDQKNLYRSAPELVLRSTLSQGLVEMLQNSRSQQHPVPVLQWWQHLGLQTFSLRQRRHLPPGAGFGTSVVAGVQKGCRCCGEATTPTFPPSSTHSWKAPEEDIPSGRVKLNPLPSTEAAAANVTRRKERKVSWKRWGIGNVARNIQQNGFNYYPTLFMAAPS